MDRRRSQRSEENIWVELEKTAAVGDSLNAGLVLEERVTRQAIYV